MRDYKILVVVMPAYGHLNPMASFINELAKTPNFKIIFPGNECDRKLIEGTKAEFRLMDIVVIDPNLNLNEMRKNPPIDKMMLKAIEIADETVPKLVKIIDEENIDLVIYDFATGHAKCLREYLHKRCKEGFINKKKLPGFIMFSPSFMCAKGIYPNKAEPVFFNTKLRGLMALKMLMHSYKFYKFSKRYGLELQDPETFMFFREELNLCCVVPELQPRSHLFDKSVVFVGSCACKP